MKPMTRLENNTAKSEVLYMAMELSQTKWCLAFGNGSKVRQIIVFAKDTMALMKEIAQAKKKLGLAADALVISCYEAGRDGFWIHRFLTKNGIKNYVVDSSSIAVDRRSRQCKTDRLDAQKLLQQLILHETAGIRFRVVRVPSEEVEDQRRVHRELDRLKKEKTAHICRLKSLLVLQGIPYTNRDRKVCWRDLIEEVKNWEGKPLSRCLKEELLREIERLILVENQIYQIEAAMANEIKNAATEPAKLVKHLMQLKGVGFLGAWQLIMEWFSWKDFKNRREVGSAAGLVGTPYASGGSSREQGITKAGNRLIRKLSLELAWMWLRYQPNSELSLWFHERFGGSKRTRKVGIVALARRLLIAIWRFTKTGEIPAGATLKTVGTAKVRKPKSLQVQEQLLEAAV